MNRCGTVPSWSRRAVSAMAWLEPMSRQLYGHGSILPVQKLVAGSVVNQLGVRHELYCHRGCLRRCSRFTSRKRSDLSKWANSDADMPAPGRRTVMTRGGQV